MAEENLLPPAARIALRTGFPSPDEVLAAAAAAARRPPVLAAAAREALERLCTGYAARPLRLAGKAMAFGILVQSVQKRLSLEAALDEASPPLSAPIERPLFIVAPPRTGTTALHRLLARHPRFRFTRAFETTNALSPDRDDRRERFEVARVALGRASPRLFDLHPVEQDEPEECFGFLETSLLSTSFLYHGAPDGYLAWIDALPDERWDEAYRIYDRQLRVLGAGPGRRWLLKSGAHLGGLPALLRAFPDAAVVTLHRPPAAALLSFCRLIEAHHAVYLRGEDRVAIGALAKDHLQRAVERAARARSAAPAGTFLDVDFEELVASPLALARKVLAFAGEENPAVVEARLSAWIRENPAPRTNRCETLETYGLSADLAAELLAPLAASRR